MIPATPRQLDLLRFIEGRIAASGVAPTFEEMRVGIGCASKASVWRLLGGLQERGHVRRLPGKARCVALVGASDLDPADAALLADVQAATADPLADPVVLRGVTMPRALARRIEAPLLRLRLAARRHAPRRHDTGAPGASDRSFHAAPDTPTAAGPSSGKTSEISRGSPA